MRFAILWADFHAKGSNPRLSGGQISSAALGEVSMIRGISGAEEALLGKAFLGTGILLCDGRGDDGGDDQAVLGASL